MSLYEKIGERESTDNEFHPKTIYNYMTKTDEEIANDIGIEDKDNANNINEDGSKRSVLHRIFSKMEAGSLRGSIFAMSSLALGTGCLALPLRFMQMSMACALLVVVLGSAAAYWSLIIMIEASKKTNSTEYSSLVKDTLGNKMAIILDLVILIYIFGILISYQVIVFQLIGSFFYEIVYSSDYSSQSDFENKLWYTNVMKFPIMFGTCLILIPLCLIKDISKMRVTSLFSIIGLIYAILVIIIETPYYYENFLKNHSPSDVNWYDFSTGFDKHLNFFKGTATVFFAYTCHVGAFPVYKTLRNNIKRRINKVFQRSIILDFVIYILVGICGFLTQPIDTPGLIINRKKILTNDIFMVIARLIMAINLILSTPANYNAFRLSILGLFWETNEVPDKLNYIITIPTILISCLIGCLYNQITSYISILGGFCSVVIAFLYPGILYIRNNEYPILHWKNIGTIILITVLTVIGYIAGIMTIIDS